MCIMDAKNLSLLHLMDSLADPRVVTPPDAVLLSEEEMVYVRSSKSGLRLNGHGFERLMELQHDLAVEAEK
jgi:hypothetical protein